MNLQEKIKADMESLAIRIIREAAKSDNEKLSKMCGCYFDLRKLLNMAEGLEQ